MATYTFNLNLAKPDMTDPASPVMFNNNFDIIDAQIAELNRYKATINGLSDTVVALRTDVDAASENITLIVNALGSVGAVLDAVNGEVI